jgi:DNA polymerase-3 subunit gamma/tau
MHQVIARAWRPQRFSEVIGQRHVTQTLQNAIRLNRIGHGYVFSGQRGVGKTTVARLLAKALNCHKAPAPEPCGECDSCREIAAGRSVDVIEIDAASNRGIDAVRELRENVRYAPARDRYKVFIIDEAHQITPEGFNALLKTLEEPPPHVVFVLATTEVHELPETILSRCQHFAFHAASFAEVLGDLQKICEAEKIAADAPALAAIAAAAGGSLRDAQSRLEQAIAAFGTQLEGAAVLRLLGAVPSQLVEEVFTAVREQKREQVLDIVARLVEDGYQLPHFCSQLVRAVRNMLVARLAGPQPHLLEASPEESERLAALAAGFSEEDLMRFLEILLQLHQQLRYAMEPRFALELGLLKLVEAERLVAIEELLGRVELPRETPARPVASPGRVPAAAATTAAPQAASPAPAARAPALTPFERDRLRKGHPGEPGRGPEASIQTSTGASTAAVTEAAPEPALDKMDMPSREESWARAVLHLLEDRKRFGLASALEGARWEFGEAEVRIQPAGAGMARALPEQDRQTLEQTVSEVAARKLRVTLVGGPEATAASSRSRPAVKPGNGAAAGSGDSNAEERARQDPEVREFERLFGAPVSRVRKLKE